MVSLAGRMAARCKTPTIGVADHEVRTTVPLDEVVTTLLRLVGADRRCSRDRHRLAEGSRSDVGLVRSVGIQFPFGGGALLVAPVLEAADRRRVYLPPGDWIDHRSEERLAGGGWIEVEAWSLRALCRAGHPRRRQGRGCHPPGSTLQRSSLAESQRESLPSAALIVAIANPPPEVYCSYASLLPSGDHAGRAPSTDES